MADNKRITLHPLLPDGTVDESVNLYPKSMKSGIVDDNGNPVELQNELVSGSNIKTVFGETLLGSGSIEADSSLDANSTKPVQNRIVTGELNSKVDLSSLQTITGKKVFQGELEANQFKTGDAEIGEMTVTSEVELSEGVKIEGKLLPKTDNNFDIGEPLHRWHNLYVSNSISDGEHSVTVENIASKGYVEEQINNKVSNTYQYKGTKTVAEINSLDTSSIGIGWVYNLSNDGYITNGGFTVIAGDNVAWTGSDWDKLGGTMELDNYYNKTETNELLDGKLDKVTSPSYPRLYAITSMGVQQTVLYGDGTNGNAVVQRTSAGQIKVPQTPTDNSHATSKEYVDDTAQNLREVAEGKCKTFVLSYADTIASVKATQGSYNFYVLDYLTGEWQDQKAELLNGDFDDVDICNSIFNSQNSLVINDFGLYIFRFPDGYGMAGNITFPDLAKIGDIVLVIETDVPDRWIAGDNTFYKLETAKVDLSNYPTKAGNETITGVWTFTNELDLTNNSKTHKLVVSGNTTLDLFLQGSDYYRFATTLFRPIVTNTIDLGSASYTWKDLYLSGNIYLGSTSSIRYTSSVLQFYVANTLVCDVYSTDTFMRTNLSPANSGFKDLGTSGNIWRNLYLSGTFNNGTDGFSIDNAMGLFNKSASDSGTEIKWSRFLTFSKSANATFTFEAAKTSCLAEYKATITNSGSSDILITLPSGVTIVSNDDNITVSNNTFMLPSGITVELNCINQCCAIINWQA